MSANPDFKDLLQELSAAGARFIVVGAHAVMFYSAPRYTKDLDIWVQAEEENAKRVLQALKNFGAPLLDLTIEDLATPGTIFQIGIEPNRIDILTDLQGLKFKEAWNKSTLSTYDGIPINILSKSDLVKNKKSVGRDQDLLDIKNLEKSD